MYISSPNFSRQLQHVFSAMISKKLYPECYQLKSIVMFRNLAPAELFVNIFLVPLLKPRNHELLKVKTIFTDDFEKDK